MNFEQEFKSLLESKGWKLLRSGWPDYAGIAPDGDKAFFEVKDGGDKVSKHQKAMHEFLEDVGVPVYVVCNKTLRRNLYSLYRRHRSNSTVTPFKILRVLQEGCYITEQISKKVETSPQLVSYHLKLLCELGIVTRTSEGYMLTENYAKTKQSDILSKLKPFVDEVRLQSKDEKETAEKIMNYFLVFMSNLLVQAEIGSAVTVSHISMK